MKYTAALLSVGVLWMLAAAVQSRIIASLPKELVNNQGQASFVIEDDLTLREKREEKSPIIIEDHIMYKRGAEKSIIQDEYRLEKKKQEAAAARAIIFGNAGGFRKKRSDRESHE